MQGQDFLHIRVYRFTHDSTLTYQLICSDSDELRTLAKMVCGRFSVPFEQSATYLNKGNANIGLIFKSSKLSYHLILTKTTFKLTLNQLLKEDILESIGIDLAGTPVNLESICTDLFVDLFTISTDRGWKLFKWDDRDSVVLLRQLQE